MKLTDLFDRIYIVNLPERDDRRREMDAELAQQGMQVDGKQIRYFPAIRPSEAGLFPSLGARGCFLSHLAILNEAIEDDLNNVLIMEDDLTLDQPLQVVPENLATRLQQGRWHFCYWGHVEQVNADASPVWQENNLPMATTHFYGLNRNVLLPLRDHLEACIHRPLGHPLGSPMHVDGAYSLFRTHAPNITTLMAVPSLGGQRSSRSDIFPNKWYDRTLVTRMLAGFARNLKNRFGNQAANHLKHNKGELHV